MEISMDLFSKTFLNKISLNITGYMEISMDPLQVKAFWIMLVSVLQDTWKFLLTLFDPFCKASEIYHNL